MKSRWMCGAIAFSCVFAASFAVDAAPTPGLTPTSPTSRPALTPKADVGFNAFFEVQDQTNTMFGTGAIFAKLQFTLPKGVSPNTCTPVVIAEVNDVPIGEDTVGTTGGAFPSGDVIRYERSVSFPQQWTPPKWKAGTYQIDFKVKEQKDGCRAMPSRKATLTVTSAPTGITLGPLPAAVGKGKPLSFTTEMKLLNGGAPVAGRAVSASVCGVAWPAKATDASGKAAFQGTVHASCPANPFTVVVRWQGDDVYGVAYAEKKISQ
ncbi:MAG TPA: hypothetical protein VM580_00530 [Labilithrix sp.]|nr:hypothetical protein [Labilithrix sp.]